MCLVIIGVLVLIQAGIMLIVGPKAYLIGYGTLFLFAMLFPSFSDRNCNRNENERNRER